MSIQERNRQKRIKNYVIERDGSICCYCDMPLTEDKVTLDHIVPDSQRGTFNTTNLTISCAACNSRRGNKFFFDYCKQFNWGEDKIRKYKRLYFNNLKIKILNIAKEYYLPSMSDEEGKVIPETIIKKACQLLKIKLINFNEYEKIYTFEIKFNELSEKNRIKFCFEQLIRIIEADNV